LKEERKASTKGAQMRIMNIKLDGGCEKEVMAMTGGTAILQSATRIEEERGGGCSCSGDFGRQAVTEQQQLLCLL
jgi:hypothetical protein